ncbi:MAG: hypothetical protein E6J33_10895 [Chloroflexi bacterium]|nr:MAG: hypothetical protein E6J33_10895 [Chloroflexota bacterium]
MGLACNILNALGGSPLIDRPEFVPQYPGPLPGAVESELIVPLARFSLDLVKNVFMVIEEPETPLNFPVNAFAAAPPLTIGQFYDTIKQLIIEGGQSIFVGNSAKQVTAAVAGQELIQVTDVNSAVQAIEMIVEQGEGTTKSPLSGQGSDIAHYYQFAEIAHGKTLIPNPNAPADAPDDHLRGRSDSVRPQRSAAGDQKSNSFRLSGGFSSSSGVRHLQLHLHEPPEIVA